MAQSLAGIEVSDSDVELEPQTEQQTAPQTAAQTSSELDPENDLGSFFSMAERFADPVLIKAYIVSFLGMKILQRSKGHKRDSSKLAEIYNHPLNANMFRLLLSTDHDDHILRFNGDKAGQRALFSVTRGSQEPIRDAAGRVIRWPACSDSGLCLVLRSVLSGVSNINKLNKMTGFIDNSTIQKLKIKQHFNLNFATSTTDRGFNNGSDSDDDIYIENVDDLDNSKNFFNSLKATLVNLFETVYKDVEAPLPSEIVDENEKNEFIFKVIRDGLVHTYFNSRGYDPEDFYALDNPRKMSMISHKCEFNGDFIEEYLLDLPAVKALLPSNDTSEDKEINFFKVL